MSAKHAKCGKLAELFGDSGSFLRYDAVGASQWQLASPEMCSRLER